MTPELRKALEGIREPFGLLKERDPELAQALIGCGGPWEFYMRGGNNGWVLTFDPNWLPFYTYRLKPQPPRPLVVDWSRLWPDAVAVVKDKSNRVLLWWLVPVAQEVKDAWWEAEDWAVDITDLPGAVIDLGTVAWRNSLVLRPKEEWA